MAHQGGRQATEASGVWAEKSMYGKTYWETKRSTFVIGPGGTITHVFPKGLAEDARRVALAAAGSPCLDAAPPTVCASPFPRNYARARGEEFHATGGVTT